MPRKRRNQPTGSRYGSVVATGRQLRIQLRQSGIELIDRQQVVVQDDPVGRMRPRQTIDPAPVRLGPRATRIVQPSAKQQFAEPVPAPLPIRACVITSPAQVAHRFRGRRRRPLLGQQPRAMQFRQLARVPPVGLDRVERFEVRGLSLPAVPENDGCLPIMADPGDPDGFLQPPWRHRPVRLAVSAGSQGATPITSLQTVV